MAIKNTQLAIYVQPGLFEAFEPLAVGEERAGMTGITIPVADYAPTYTVDRYGKPMLLSINETPPGALPGATLTIFEEATLNYLEGVLAQRKSLAIQRRIIQCGLLDDPTQWDKIMHCDGANLTAYNPGDGPSQAPSGDAATAAGTFVFRRVLFLVKANLSEQSLGETPEVANFLDIAGISDNVQEDDCGDGYPGPDQVLYACAAADTGVVANLWWTNNGGGLWTALAGPFGADEDISTVVAYRNGFAGVYVILGNGTGVALTPPEIAWAEGDWGDEGNLTFANVSLASADDAVAVTALELIFHNRLYIGLSDGNIHLSTDKGQSDPGAAIYDGANQINGFTRHPVQKDVYAFGASNTILREQNRSGTFSGRVGPSGGGDFHSLAIAEDGTMYAGNGTALYRSINLAQNTGGWSLVHDFGTGARVVGIRTGGFQPGLGGSAQVLDIIVDDTTPGSGIVWRTTDGGATLIQVGELQNSGYNAFYGSEADINKLWVVGDAHGGEGQIHLMTPNS